MGINGDNEYIIWVDVSGLSAGYHTVTVAADGLSESTASFKLE
jgi:hypothetical protein